VLPARRKKKQWRSVTYNLKRRLQYQDMNVALLCRMLCVALQNALQNVVRRQANPTHVATMADLCSNVGGVLVYLLAELRTAESCATVLVSAMQQVVHLGSMCPDLQMPVAFEAR
jgi:hypothetical protein